MKPHTLLTALIDEARRSGRLEAQVKETEERLAKAASTIEVLGRRVMELEREA